MIKDEVFNKFFEAIRTFIKNLIGSGDNLSSFLDKLTNLSTLLGKTIVPAILSMGLAFISILPKLYNMLAFVMNHADIILGIMGAGKGALIGSVLGPWGALGGGLIGGGFGLAAGSQVPKVS